jgi:MFS family permease
MTDAVAPRSVDGGIEPPMRRRPWAGMVAGWPLLVLITGTNVPSPLYALYADRFGFSALTLTLIVAVYASVIVPSLLVAGPLADVIGYRRLVFPSLLLAAAGSALFALATGTGWLVAARAVQGLAVGAATPALTAALVSTVPVGASGRGALLASTMTTAGSGLGPLLAAALAAYAPAPMSLPYLVELALLASALVIALRLPVAASRRRWRPAMPHVPVATRPRFAVAAMVAFLAWAVAYVMLALAPSYAAARVHGTGLLIQGATSGLLLLCAAASQFVLAPWPAHRAETIGLTALIIGLLGLVIAGHIDSAPLLLAAVAIAGCGQGLAFMGATRQAVQHAPVDKRAGIAAAFWIASYLGGGLPVIGVGLLAVHTTVPTAVTAFAVALAIACVPMIIGVRKHHVPAQRLSPPSDFKG